MLSEYLNSRAFFAGLIISFSGLSVTGWLATDNNLFSHFTRFHRDISPETLYYPTARQISALVQHKAIPNKVIVIIGGSSVFRGTGQSSDDLWSNKLQQELGESYEVLNLAVNAGGAAGIGLYMTEHLAMGQKKVIFIANVAPHKWAVRDSGGSFPSFYFDAISRGSINLIPARQEFFRSSLTTEGFIENLLRAKLNSILNFNETWGVLGFDYFFTIWTPITRNSPWMPRKLMPDSEVSCNPEFGYAREPERELQIMRDFGKRRSSEDTYDSMTESIVPKHLKANTIFLIESYSPYYINKISDFERVNYKSSLRDASKYYGGLGFSTVVVSDGYGESDYCDRSHFSSAGALRLAKNIAPLVRQKAKELKYVVE